MSAFSNQKRNPEEQGSRLARNSLLTFVGYALPTVVGVVTIPLILKGLGTDRFGVLSLVWLVLGYLGAFDLGIGRSLTKYLAEAINQRDTPLALRLVWAGSIAQIPIGLVSVLGFAAATPWLVRDILNLSEPLASESRIAFYLVAVSMPVCQLTSLYRGVLEGCGRFDLSNLIKAPAGIASFTLPLIGLWLGFGLPGIVASLFVARFLTLVAHLVLCRRVGLFAVMGLSLDRGLFSTLFRFGGWATISTTVQQLQLYIERFVIGSVFGITAVSYYSVPSDMIGRIAIIPLSIGTALFPSFSVSSEGARQQILPVSARSLKFLLTVLTPITTVAIVFAPNILAAWVGSEFSMAATSATRLLIVSFLLGSIGYIPYTIVHGQGKPEWKAKLDLVELPAFVLLSYILMPVFGLAGVALSRLIVQIVDVTSLFVMATRLLDVRFGELFQLRCTEATAIAGALTLASLMVSSFSPSLLISASVVSAGLAIYFFLTWKLVMDDRDLSVITSTCRIFSK